MQRRTSQKEENSETAEAGTTRNKRTLEGVEGENGGTEKGLKEDKGRKGKRRGGRSVPAFMDPLAKRGRCTQLYTSTKPKDGYHWITSEGINKTKSCPRLA